MTFMPTPLVDAAGPFAGHAPLSDVQPPVWEAGVRVLDYQCRERECGHTTAASYPCHTIVAVRQGAFCYGDHGYTRLLEPGALVLGVPGDAYTSSHDYGCGDVCTIFQYGEATWAQLRADLGDPMPRAAVFAQSPGLEALLPASASVEPEGREESAYRVAAAVLTALSGGACEVPPSLRRSDRDRAHEVAAHIEAHHAAELPLGALAAIAGMSPFHFLRLFQRELGLTPHQYLIRTRLRRAVALLRDTRFSVTEVALAVGYGDLSNFVRTFRKQVGCTPEAFRRAA